MRMQVLPPATNQRGAGVGTSRQDPPGWRYDRKTARRPPKGHRVCPQRCSREEYPNAFRIHVCIYRSMHLCISLAAYLRFHISMCPCIYGALNLRINVSMYLGISTSINDAMRLFCLVFTFLCFILSSHAGRGPVGGQRSATTSPS